MNSKVLQLFKVFNCQAHSNSSIIQVCISASCTEKNKLCCLECVDEHHSGQDHVLISHTKFSTLLQEFHVVAQEKKLLNEKLFQKLQSERSKLNTELYSFFNLARKNLCTQSQIAAYEQINNIDAKNIQNSQIKQKINEIVTNHSWILELNTVNVKRQCSTKQCHQNLEVCQVVKEALNTKYSKLQKKLIEITAKTSEQIQACLQKHSKQVKKLFHQFDEIKYKLQDNGSELDNFSSHTPNNQSKSSTQASPMDSPSKNQSSPVKKKQMTYNQYINSLMD